jgi:hypothetical protein
MSALTAPRSTAQYGGSPFGVLPETFAFTVSTGVTLYQGALAVVSASTGTVQPMTQASSLVVAGRCEAGNGGVSSFAAGTQATIREGAFLWDLDPNHKPTAANFGALVYGLDDHTIGTNASSSSIAGVFLGLDPVSGQAIVLTTFFASLL